MPESGIRRSIRTKVAAAFALLALVPLLVLTAVAAASAVRYLRGTAEATLEYDLEIARLRAARSLRQVGQNLDFLVEAVLRDRIHSPDTPANPRDLTSVFLATDSTAILRVKAIDFNGDLVFINSVLDEGEPEEGGSGELFYLFQAEEAPPGGTLYLPVELRGPGRSSDLEVIPALAILEPIAAPGGDLGGVAVAEASLAALFEGLELASPGLSGVTGLVDASGRFLYHSERKNDWASLLASQGSINLGTDFDESTASQILSGEVGTIRTADGGIVTFRPLARGDLDAPLLVLYRAVAPGAVSAGVSQFLLLTSLVVLGTLAVVLWAARLAANQVTQPLFELQRAARSLADGDDRQPIRIDTGDELEELATDFTRMADALKAQQTQLEELIADRTSALVTTRSELEQVIRHAADAIIGLDMTGRIRFWNRGAEDLFGYTEDEATDHDIDGLIGEDASSMERSLLRDALGKGETVAHLRTQRRPQHGEPFPVTLTQAPVTDAREQTVGASLVIRDHRAQTRIEQQMRQSERLAAASIMAAGLAHEINNPLAILQNRIELMQREVEDDSVMSRDLAVLQAHVDRLRGITSDLLSFAKDDSSTGQEIALDELAKGVVDLLSPTFLTKGVALSYRIDEVPLIEGNEKAMEAVLFNLLTNAVQATPAGGAVRVNVGFDQSRDRLRVAVEDTGPGINKDLQERIFEPFFTTKGGGANKGGTGLGLTLCRTIVERHGGKLFVDSQYETGTRFVVELPRTRG